MHPNDLTVKSNVRRDIESSPGWEDFVLSVESVGVLTPITYYVENGKKIVHDGHRRLLAAKICGLEDIPAARISRPSEENHVLHQAISGIQRENLNDMDLAVAMADLVERYGVSQKDLASSMGRSAAWVSQHLALLDAPRAIQERVQSGDLSYRAGYEARAFTQEDLKEHGGAISAATTVREIKKLKRNIEKLREMEAPVQQAMNEVDGKIVVEDQPDEQLLKVVSLLDTAKEMVAMAKDVAKESGLDISQCLEELRGEI